MYVHTGGEDRGQGSSEAWHCYNVVTGVSMRPRDKQVWNVHCGGYTDWVITLIDLTGNKIKIYLVYFLITFLSCVCVFLFNSEVLTPSIIIIMIIIIIIIIVILITLF